VLTVNQLDGLVECIADYIRSHVRAAVGNLQRADGEIRTVFHGPPLGYFGQFSDRDRVYTEVRYNF